MAMCVWIVVNSSTSSPPNLTFHSHTQHHLNHTTHSHTHTHRRRSSSRSRVVWESTCTKLLSLLNTYIARKIIIIIIITIFESERVYSTSLIHNVGLWCVGGGFWLPSPEMRNARAIAIDGSAAEPNTYLDTWAALLLLSFYFSRRGEGGRMRQTKSKAKQICTVTYIFMHMEYIYTYIYILCVWKMLDWWMDGDGFGEF